MIICIHQAQAQRCQMGKPKAPNAFTNLGLLSESSPLKPKSTLILSLGLSARPISIILDRPRTLTPSHAWIGLQLKPKYSSSPQLTPLNAPSSSKRAFTTGGTKRRCRRRRRLARQSTWPERVKTRHACVREGAASDLRVGLLPAWSMEGEIAATVRRRPEDVAAVADDRRSCPRDRSNAGRTACRRQGESARDLKA